MIFLVIGGCLTIIGGVLLGMFFLYPLANVIPEEQYIEVFEEEFTMLIAILGFGLLSLIIGFIFEGIALSIEYEAYYKKTEGNKLLKEVKVLHERTLKELGLTNNEIDKLKTKNIMSGR